MSTAFVASGQRSALAAIAQSYFEALSDGDFSRVPWAPGIVLRTPLHRSGPIQGRAAVEAFFRPMIGNLGSIHMRESYVNENQDTVVSEADVGPLHVLDKFVIRAGQIVEQTNVFDPRPVLEAPSPGGISADERTLLVEMLEDSRLGLRAVIEAASDSCWNQKPADGGWSAAECAEHLALTEDALLGMIRGQILASPGNPALAAELQGKDGIVVQAMHDRSAKGKTFDFLEPKGKWTDRLAVLDAWLARRATTLDFARSTRDPLHHHAAPLGALGLIDGYQWLLLIAAHTERHVAQMREALARPTDCLR